ncbi:MAG: hypothetical protein IPL62_16620 [Caulobacteraceae bacterium]|nr:hypothetical protein [Caulobacteraceae bacterium]
MRQFRSRRCGALLAACGAGADGPPLPRVQAGATPPSTQSPGSPTEQTTVTDEVRQQLITQIGQLLTQTQQQFASARTRSATTPSCRCSLATITAASSISMPALCMASLARATVIAPMSISS